MQFSATPGYRTGAALASAKCNIPDILVQVSVVARSADKTSPKV